MVRWYAPKSTHCKKENKQLICSAYVRMHGMTVLNDGMLKLLSSKIYVNMCISALRAFQQSELNAKMNNESRN